MRRKLFLLLMLIPVIVWLSGGCAKKPVREVTECTETISAPSDTTSTFTFTLEDNLEKITVPEAEDIMGIPVTTPVCLPDGYEIKDAYIKEPRYFCGNEVLLLISDEIIEHQGFDTTTKMVIRVTYGCGPGLKGPAEVGEPVTIREEPRLRGVFVSDEDWTKGNYNELWYQFVPIVWGPNISDPCECLEIVIMAIRDITKEDLVKIAASTLY